VNTFKGKFSDWAMAPMPGDGGAAKGALGGGNGYFFKKGLTADQIKAGLKWLAFEELTPGEGQFNYTVQKSIGLPVGLPQPLIWKPGSDLQKKDDDLKKAILDGVKMDGKEVMPAFKDGGVTPEQADALVKYTRTFKK